MCSSSFGSTVTENVQLVAIEVAEVGRVKSVTADVAQAGRAFIGATVLDITAFAFTERLAATISVNDVLVGLSNAPVFAFLIKRSGFGFLGETLSFGFLGETLSFGFLGQTLSFGDRREAIECGSR